MSRSGMALSLCMFLVAAVGCSSQQPAPVEPTSTDASNAPEATIETPTAETTAEPSSPTPTGAEEQPAPTSQEAEPEPTTPETTPTHTPEPPATTSQEAAPESASTVDDPGGTVEVASTKDGLSRIGSDKCKLCHKVQFASWSESAHAQRTPPLDCESCHGPGSEYKGLKVMKDPEKARAAGLVIPDDAFCAKCHTAGVTAELRQGVHEHKAPES